jgi:2-phosphoxylose phosphatase
MNHVLSTISVTFCIGVVVLYSLLAYGYSFAVSRFPITSSSTISVDLNWHPPSLSWIANLTTVVNGTGTFGFQFDGSGQSQDQSDGVGYHYNYCNMPRVRKQEYPIPENKYKLVYVELVRQF